MARATGQRLPASTRRQAVATLQGLIAAGVSDTEAREQIAERYDVSERTFASHIVELVVARPAP